jgi:putative transposase
MKRKKFKEEQIIKILKEHEAGTTIVDLARRHGIAENTLYRWKARYGGLEVSEAKRLRELEHEHPAEEAAGRSRARQGDAEGCARKKVLKPMPRREVVGYLIEAFHVSERRACRCTGFQRSSHRYRCQARRDDGVLRAQIETLATKYPRYGAPTLHAMLRAEGHVQNHKRTERVYRAIGLQVPRRRRKRLVRPQRMLPIAAAINARWSMDFIHDQLACGRRFRVLSIVDDCSRECVAQLVDTSISGVRVVRLLEELALTRGLPDILVMDNGSEFTSKALFFWAQKTGVDLHFSQPGKPTQNAFIESFNGKFRDYCLDLNWFSSLDDARRQIAAWRDHYNRVRPHSSLGMTPEAYARRALRSNLGAPPSSAALVYSTRRADAVQLNG